jgi:hypothetical protein
MSKHTSEILSAIAQLTAQVAELKSMLAERQAAPSVPTAEGKKTKKVKKEKDPDAPKKEPNTWLLFTSRVHQLLEQHPEMKLKRTVEIQFASALKQKKAISEWADADILAERKSWVAPEPQEKPKKAPKGGSGGAAAAPASDSESDSASSEPKKRRGPKKLAEMSAEELEQHKKKVAERKNKKTAPAAAAEASGSDSESESEDVLVKKAIGGKKYLWNPSSNQCFHMEADGSQGELAGIYDAVSGKIKPSE